MSKSSSSTGRVDSVERLEFDDSRPSKFDGVQRDEFDGAQPIERRQSGRGRVVPTTPSSAI